MEEKHREAIDTGTANDKEQKPVSVEVIVPARKKRRVIPYLPGFTCTYLVPDPFNTGL